MGAFKIFLWTSLILIGWRFYRSLVMIPDMPQLDPNPWWGPGPRGSEKTEILPFKIDIPKKDLKDLNLRLKLPQRIKPSLENSNFTYGFNSETLKLLHQHWLNKYDWRTREKKLNQFPHFKSQIEGLDIHFIHVSPSPKDLSPDTIVVPILLLHGWPGSIVEFYQMIPMLTKPNGRKFAFEIVCPSLPGFGFSQPSSKKGLGPVQISQIFVKLMKRLKHPQFYVQGGDWGSIIASSMATMYPDNVIGMHLNLVGFIKSLSGNLKLAMGAFLPSGWIMSKEAERFFYPLSNYFSLALRESGYFHIQATKPDTIGSALSYSPIGLAAYIIEKFSTGTHLTNPQKPDGGLLEPTYPFSFDQLLDNVCIYWFTNSITSSSRIYSEYHTPLTRIPSKVPAGFALFPQEAFNQPENFITDKYTDIVSYTRFPHGGHFAAMEQPQVLADDLFKFVSAVEERKYKTNNFDKKQNEEF